MREETICVVMKNLAMRVIFTVPVNRTLKRQSERVLKCLDGASVNVDCIFGFNCATSAFKSRCEAYDSSQLRVRATRM